MKATIGERARQLHDGGMDGWGSVIAAINSGGNIHRRSDSNAQRACARQGAASNGPPKKLEEQPRSIPGAQRTWLQQTKLTFLIKVSEFEALTQKTAWLRISSQKNDINSERKH